MRNRPRNWYPLADFPLLIVVSERKINSEWPTICPEPWSSFPRTPSLARDGHLADKPTYRPVTRGLSLPTPIFMKGGSADALPVACVKGCFPSLCRCRDRGPEQDSLAQYGSREVLVHG